VRYDVHTILRGETPGVDPTHRKRGPRRPHRIGRRGRLPLWLASPRRGFFVYLVSYMNVPDEFTSLALFISGRAMRIAVVALFGG
jgi:hypothetical protein